MAATALVARLNPRAREKLQKDHRRAAKALKRCVTFCDRIQERREFPPPEPRTQSVTWTLFTPAITRMAWTTLQFRDAVNSLQNEQDGESHWA
jgi:hypothetical protein